ncbi:MAG: family serine peptidase [Actinomycetia bacterium]|nr:family serine peptidase [Actinomycetes bacterium]
MRASAPPQSRTALFVVVGLLVAAVVVLPGRLLTVKAHAATPLNPDDPGRVAQPAGWAQLQWNFVSQYGVDAPHAWGNLIAARAPGGAGVIVAVLDTGVAYRGNSSSTRGSPDLSPTRFVRGYDFVDGDADPFDDNGHGTHVASTIAEQTNNGYGLTGLAYGVRIMPVRVLDQSGEGGAATIARGLRFAADHGAKVINLSLNFKMGVTGGEIQDLLDAISYAHQRGSVIVAGAGNAGTRPVTYPARSAHVVAVGATTEHGCLANYSNDGSGLDLVAPGGGSDAAFTDDPACRAGRSGPPIYQITLGAHSTNRFDIAGYIGTSMAAPHVSATAALVVASGVIGANPSPAAIEARLEQTARDLGHPGYDTRYGWGLVDAATATSPGAARRPPPLTAPSPVAP